MAPGGQVRLDIRIPRQLWAAIRQDAVTAFAEKYPFTVTRARRAESSGRLLPVAALRRRHRQLAFRCLHNVANVSSKVTVGLSYRSVAISP
jgi:hypothetical protein